jgi:DNA-binding NarL/FixJ family response regulator
MNDDAQLGSRPPEDGAAMLDILVAEDHEITRRGIRALLEDRGWNVCAEATNGREAVALAASKAPHVAILDLSMPELNGIEATRQILKVSPATKVLIFTVQDSEDLAREVLSAGAQGYVLKTDAASDLVSAVIDILSGTPHLSARISPPRSDSARCRVAPPGEVPTLTAREREITQLLAEGKTNGRIARILGISIKTVETHRGNIMHKLGLESIVELVHYAVRNQLVEP